MTCLFFGVSLNYTIGVIKSCSITSRIVMPVSLNSFFYKSLKARRTPLLLLIAFCNEDANYEFYLGNFNGSS